jgi:hypothetical protein
MLDISLALLLICLFPGPQDALAPWGTNHHPTDAPKRHVEQVTSSKHAYMVRQGGTMDGSNCRSPLSVGMMDGPALQQTWESNRSVRIENVGETDVINPWLSNGRNDFRTMDEIVQSAVAPGMSERDKAFAIWFQEIRHRYHMGGDNNELGDPVKVFNVYGHNTCGNDSICLAGLWKRAGLKVSPAHVVGHCITQAYFDGRWNLFDGDMHSMYLLRDNRTIASEQDLVRDHDLIKRSHTQGILNPDKRANDEWEASIFVYEGKPSGDRNSATGTTMNMKLRPGEAMTWRWGHTTPPKYHGDSKPKYPDTICNGLWEYTPDLSKEHWKRGATEVKGIRTTHGALIHELGETGTITWIMRSPYIFVGGHLEVQGSGVRFAVSWDGKAWQEAGRDLTKFFAPEGPARYEYRLRCELTDGAKLERLSIVNDLQMAPQALPEMAVGDNRFVYSDQSRDERKVRITHAWIERSASQPLSAPAAAVVPADGGTMNASDLLLQWQPPSGPASERAVDYQFELSDRADMRWPLSPNFYKLISNTADRGQARYRLPQSGLLAPDATYYWHVRAKNEAGVWGPWSRTWRFSTQGPAAPVDVNLVVDAARGTGVLRWKPNPVGSRPAKYRIYASDEKGFSISDEMVPTVVGASKQVAKLRPPNFVAEVSDTEAHAIGAALTFPNANRAFYRVVAVDDREKRSGPSDYAETPRPLIYSSPVTQAKVGVDYRYALTSIHSLGDLRTRVVNGKEVMNYWDIEAPRFAIEQGPAWLKIDPMTGVLTGIPTSPGKATVVVTATLDHETRQLDPTSLSWGVEKLIGTAKERTGMARQEFAIEVRR